MQHKPLQLNPYLTGETPHSMVERLQHLAQIQADKTALVVVSDKEGVLDERSFTYGELDIQIKRLAAELQLQCRQGDRVLLMLDNNEHYVISFFACLYAGLIAVPLFVPESSRSQHIQRVVGIALNCQATAILAHSADHQLVELAKQEMSNSGLNAASLMFVDQLNYQENTYWQAHTPQPQELAFLQYTSGSTAAPKGVMVSHGNLIANEIAISEGSGVIADEVVVSWLPLYHDMGLMAGLILPLFNGSKCVLMSPRYFLEKPIRWLEAIARHRGTSSGGPDFGYRLCVERIRPSAMANLDLSSWQVAFSGAEPVRVDTLDSFFAQATPAGFNPQAIYPCYGLAEATLFVTGPKRQSGLMVQSLSAASLAQGIAQQAEHGVKQVACGVPASHHSIRITDSTTKAALPAGHVGEIWVSGPSIAQGYWQNPAATADTFVEHEQARWLRTGDLGVWQDNQLYIVGRIKDLIISHGRNIYPQDIEKIIEAEFEFARKGRIAVFAATDNHSEGVGVALEIARKVQRQVSPQLLVNRLKEIVAEYCDESVTGVLMMQPASLPKTSSGKLQRSACKQMWTQAAELSAAAELSEDNADKAYAIYAHNQLVRGQTLADTLAPAPLSEHEQALANIWQAVLNRKSDFSRDAHFLAEGGNSLKAVQLIHAIEQHWQVKFDPTEIFHCLRLGEQADAILAASQRQQLVAKEASDVSSINSIIANEYGVEQAVPMSHAQARLWFLWQLEPHSSAYNIGARINLHSDIDATRLQNALNTLVAEHQALRTRFDTDELGTAIQVVAKTGHWPLQQFDLSNVEAPQQASALAELVATVSQYAFDLTKGDVVNAALINLGEQGYQLILVMHHIVSDGVSMQILLDQLAHIYLGTLSASKVREDAITYQDFSLWQRSYLTSDAAQAQLAWWQAQLACDEQPILQLCTDFPRVNKAHSPENNKQLLGANHSVVLPAQLVKQLRRQAAKQNASLFMVMLASFHALLYRHTGQHDIRVGIPVANRHLPQLQELVGFFVNTQVIPAKFSGQVCLQDIVAQVKTAVLGAQANQDVPFEYLVEALAPERSVDTHPLFQVMFSHTEHDTRAWQPLVATDTNLSARAWQPLEVAPQFDLTLETYELEEDQVALEFVYPRALFLPQTIARMAEQYVALLHAQLESGATPFAQLCVQTTAEQAWLTQVAKGPAVATDDSTIYQLFEQQVKRTPDAPALIFNQQTVSYDALNQRANQLAHYLKSRGIGPEDCVGMALERGIEMYVTLFAIWKAGAAYVPLDPTYPEDRLVHMVKDSGVKLVLTNAALVAHIPNAENDIPVLAYEHIALGDFATTNPTIASHSQHLAYVIYTSGSTGLPKGVAVTHGPLSMHIQNMVDVYGVDSEHTELQFFSINFDAAGEQWMTPLIKGGALVLATKAQLNVEAVSELINVHKVTALHLPPAYLRLLTPHLHDCKQIRTCIVGGEEFSRTDYQDAHRAFSAPRIVNAYGPTETIITPTAWISLPGELHEVSTVPIGKPIGAREAYILDADLNPVPQGASGELYVGGRGVARGYLGRPALTAERFVANPFSSDGEVLYRTGDLVRWNQHDELEYLGRIDHQVKIRGFRIELGEVEAQLMALPHIKEAVVLAKDGDGQHGHSGTHLVAYVGAKANGQGVLPSAQTLKQSLLQKLPDYMVPSCITVLANLPVTANGKIDRHHLPEPQWGSGESHQVPTGGLAKKVAAIWAEVLGLDAKQIGLHDNFFDLGGHSLLFGQIQQRLEAEFSCKLTMLELFHMTTVSAMATYFEQRTPEGAANAQQAVAKEMKKASARGQRQRQAFLKKTRTKVES
ncbi:amino acid adenylation domain-containing protein [Pseudoalteromonas sp. Isolate6]|uniref:non-ribosomal peptide synthetase n=1 Tax=Pseudoalteromonas sp. Isolate6 TaxID=2908527 RepID=UPI001EFDA824|nr:non-ribosomal peptide synthetase [Pseudoalteromonas sp. Isolate6]MCG9758582.1 amino acid adenylation domain-containing protein [Pseudoalteromonas sp. Isolate6]